MSSVTQFNFSGGELTPELHGNTGLEKYRTGLKKLRNCTVKKTGGVWNRAGSEFIAEINDSTKDAKFIPFIFSDSQTYVLEFGDLYMRVHKNGVQLKEAAKAITGAAISTQTVIDCVGHGYSNGDEIYISGIVGMTELNRRWFKVSDVHANDFKIKLMDGSTYVNTTTYGTYVSGGTAEKVYQITTPYAVADLPLLQFSQSADIITIAHRSYAPRELSRSGDTTWTLSAIDFLPSTVAPTVTSLSAAGGAFNVRYHVTAVDKDSGEESLPGLNTTFTATITAMTNANPGVFTTSAAHGLNALVPEWASITGLVGVSDINNNPDYYVIAIAADTFKLKHRITGVDLDTTSLGAYSSGGTLRIRGLYAAGVAFPQTLTIVGATNAAYYRVYINPAGSFDYYGLVATIFSQTFYNTGITPSTTDLLPQPRNPFFGSGNYPKAVAHAQQRIFFASTTNNPETIWGSTTGAYHNFITRSTITDDGPITATLANRRVNEIRHLIDLEKMLCLLAGSAISLNGSQSGFVTPTEVNAKTLPASSGSDGLRPLITDSSVIYLQARASLIKDISFVGDSYSGNDLTLFAKHLFDGFTIVDWDYQENPDSIVWAVRSDGVLLSMTYVPEQKIIAWAKHDFRNGTVENVCVVPEGTEDKVYLVIARTINGRATKYIERLSNRFIDDVIDNAFMDSFLTYDGRNTGATTMTLTGSGWTYQDTLTLTASSGTFVSTDVGNQIHLTGSDGTKIRCSITAYTSTTVVSVKPHKTVPASMRAVAITTWARAVDRVTGLWHLEGESVSIFADGFVVASPYNADYTAITVTNGAIDLPKCYATIHVGLPYLSDVETLAIDSPNIETLSNKKILITEVTARVWKTKGLWFGREAPTDDSVDALEGLTELKLRSNESLDDPIDLKTGVVDVQIETKWSEGGNVFIRQVDPIPMSIISLTPTGIIPTGGR